MRFMYQILIGNGYKVKTIELVRKKNRIKIMKWKMHKAVSSEPFKCYPFHTFLHVFARSHCKPIIIRCKYEMQSTISFSLFILCFLSHAFDFFSVETRISAYQLWMMIVSRFDDYIFNSYEKALIDWIFIYLKGHIICFLLSAKFYWSKLLSWLLLTIVRSEGELNTPHAYLLISVNFFCN